LTIQFAKSGQAGICGDRAYLFFDA
jgi:hypothetical protein